MTDAATEMRGSHIALTDKQCGYNRNSAFYSSIHLDLLELDCKWCICPNRSWQVVAEGLKAYLHLRGCSSIFTYHGLIPQPSVIEDKQAFPDLWKSVRLVKRTDGK